MMLKRWVWDLIMCQSEFWFLSDVAWILYLKTILQVSTTPETNREDGRENSCCTQDNDVCFIFSLNLSGLKLMIYIFECLNIFISSVSMSNNKHQNIIFKHTAKIADINTDPQSTCAINDNILVRCHLQMQNWSSWKERTKLKHMDLIPTSSR